MADSNVRPLSEEEKIAAEVDLHQAKHRFRLIDCWGGLSPGSRILELGCGQGTCTEVLAEAVGTSGFVDAVDPGEPDYGAPVTLAQAHAGISAGPLGARIRWHRAMPEEFLQQVQEKGERWDAAVLAHCIWYFKSPSALESILAALKGRVDRVLVAEYALHASIPAAVPHVLASLARATLEGHRAVSDENIQIIRSSESIRRVAEGGGWKAEREATLVPESGLLDGKWEIGTVISEKFLTDIDGKIADERIRLVLRAGRDAVLAGVSVLGGLQHVRTMDVWSAVLIEK